MGDPLTAFFLLLPVHPFFLLSHHTSPYLATIRRHPVLVRADVKPTSFAFFYPRSPSQTKDQSYTPFPPSPKTGSSLFLFYGCYPPFQTLLKCARHVSTANMVCGKRRFSAKFPLDPDLSTTPTSSSPNFSLIFSPPPLLEELEVPLVFLASLD